MHDSAWLRLAEPFDLVKAKEVWLAALAESEALARARPPEELGCLYYSRGEERFVVPHADGTLPEDVVVHFGSPGGVVPRVPGQRIETLGVLAGSCQRRYDACVMMTRTQILLDSALLKRVRRRAAEAGISLAEYIRRLVERDLETPRVVREPSAVFDLGDSGGADIAAHKDRMIGEAMAARQKGDRSGR